MSTAKTKSDQCLSNKINEAKSIAQDFQNSISNAMTDFKDAFQLTAKCLALSDLYPTFAGLVAKSSCLIRVSVLFEQHIDQMLINNPFIVFRPFWQFEVKRFCFPLKCLHSVDRQAIQ